MKIVITQRHFWFYTLVIHLTRAIDVFPEPIIQVALRATFDHFLFVIKFNLRYQKASKAAGVVVQTSLFLIPNRDGKVRIHPVTPSGSEGRCLCSRPQRVNKDIAFGGDRGGFLVFAGGCVPGFRFRRSFGSLSTGSRPWRASY